MSLPLTLSMKVVLSKKEKKKETEKRLNGFFWHLLLAFIPPSLDLLQVL